MAGINNHPVFNITFGPVWWNQNYNMVYNEDFWQDPIARTERDIKQRHLLFERFGNIGLGEQNPQPKPNIEAYGHRVMAAFWGCKIVYIPDQAPSAEVLPDARTRMENLEIPD